MKPFLSIEEKIKYMKDVKNIEFANEKKAKNILLYHNYLNIVYPYKHNFYEKNSQNEAIKIDGRHQYRYSVSFDEYTKHYIEDEEKRALFATKIIMYEKQLKSILIEQLGKIYNNDFNTGNIIIELQKRGTKNYHDKTIKDLEKTIRKTPNIYVSLDKQALGNVRNIIEMHIEELEYDLFKRFSFGATNFSDFLKKLYKIIHLRNYAIHGNSMRIAIYVKDIKTNELRTSKQASEYNKLVHSITDFDSWQDFKESK